MFEPQISDCTRKYTSVQSFRRLVKENHVWFYEKHLRRYEDSSLKQTIVLPNGSNLVQEFKNFNRDEMGNEELLGSDNNDKEKE